MRCCMAPGCECEGWLCVFRCVVLKARARSDNVATRAVTFFQGQFGTCMVYCHFVKGRTKGICYAE